MPRNSGYDRVVGSDAPKHLNVFNKSRRPDMTPLCDLRDVVEISTGLARRSAAPFQWFRRRGTLRRLSKELGNVDRQCLGKAIENVDGWVFLLPLKAADVGAVYSCVKGEPFLREASPHPNSPQIPGHQSAPLHAQKRPHRRLLNHWLYPVNCALLPANLHHMRGK